MSPNLVLSLSISFFFCVCQAEVLQLVRVAEFVVLLEKGFGFEILEGFEDLVDFLVDYGHFLIKNQLKSK